MALNELQQAAKELGVYNKNTAKKQKKKREERHNYWVNKTNESGNSNKSILDPLGLSNSNLPTLSSKENKTATNQNILDPLGLNHNNLTQFKTEEKKDTNKNSYGYNVDKDKLKNYIWTQTGIMPIDPQNRRKSINNSESQTEENSNMNKVDALLTGGAKISNDLGINTSAEKRAANDKIISDYEAKKLQKKIENKTITQDEVNELYDYVMWYNMSNEELKKIVDSPTDSLTDPMTGNPYKEEKRQKAWSLYGSRLLNEVSDETKYKIEKDLENDKRDVITIKNRLKEDGFDSEETDLIYNYITGNYTKGTRLAELIEDHPVAMSLASVMFNEVSGLPAAVETATELIDKATDSDRYEQRLKNGNYDNKRSKNFQYTNAANEIRSGVSKKIADSFENENLGKAASLVYGAGMSMLDNIASRSLGGGNKALSLGLMSSTAFSNQTVDTINNGGTITEAAVKGVASAVIEAATENISWNSMQKFLGSGKNGFTSFMLSATKEALPEGMEEGISYVAGETFNALYDSLSAASNGDFTTRFMPQYDLNELFENVVSGILSGYGMSTGAAYAQSVNTKITGNIYLERGKENVILDTAKNAGIKTAATEKALNALNEFCENEYKDTEEGNNQYFKLQNKAGRAIGALNNTLQEKLEGTALQEYNNQLNDTNEGTVEEKYSAAENNNTKDFIKQFLNKGNTTQAAETVEAAENDRLNTNGAFVDNTDSNINTDSIIDNDTSIENNTNSTNFAVKKVVRDNKLAKIRQTAKSETALNDLTEHIDDQFYKIVYNETVNVPAVFESSSTSVKSGTTPTVSGADSFSTKGVFSAEERSAEFNRIYEMGIDEDIPPYEIESDIYTPEQVRRIYAAGVIDDNARNNYSEKLSFTEILKEYEDKANKVQKLTDELPTAVKENIKGIKGVLFERLNADQKKITKFLNSKRYNVQWFSAEKNISGFTDGNTIYLNANTDTNTELGKVTFKHEFAHTLENLDGFNKFAEHIENSKLFKNWIETKSERINAEGTDNNKLSAVINSYIERQSSVKELSNKQAKNEVYADFIADTLFSSDSVSETVNKMENAFENKSGFRQFVDAIINTLRKIKGFFTDKGYDIKLLENEFVKLKNNLDKQNKNTDSNSGVKYSLNENFNVEYDDWDKKNPRKVFNIGTTSKVLQSLSIPYKEITWDSSKIIKIKNKHSEMTDAIIKQVPQIIESPIIVMQSKTKVSRITMFGEVYANNKPILVVLELNPNSRNGLQLDELKIASAYGKDNAQRFIDSSKILYVDNKKKRVSNWEKRTGLQLPVGYSVTNSNTNISQNDKGVNSSIPENNSNDTDIRYSIANTKNMSWEKQINAVLNNKKAIKHSDTLVIENNTPEFLVESGISDLPLAVPISIITKAKSGKNESHKISDINLVNLKNAIEHPVAVINDDSRNSLLFVTNLKENGGNIVVTFDKNTTFDGDKVHKATSIHSRQNMSAYFESLKNARIYCENENKLIAASGSSINLERLKLNNKFINIKISQENKNVNTKFSVDEKMQQLVDEYGAIPKGMNAEREIEVPKKTSENKYTSYAARSIMEMGSIDDETLEKIKKQVVDEALSHKRLGDKEALDYADRQIKDGEAEKIWGDVVSGQSRVDKYSIATGEALLEMYAQHGDAEKVLNITAELCEVGTRVGQAVQAFSLLKKQGGVGRVYYLQKVRNQINRELDNKFGKIKGEKYHVEIGEEEVKLLLNAKNDEEVTEAAQKIMKSLGEQVPSTFLDKWNAWRYLAMLGNLRTHIRNLIGNAVFVPAVKIKNGFATAIEHIAIRDVGKRTKAVKVSKDVKEFAEKDYFEVEDLLTSDGKFQDGGEVQQFQKVFTSKAMRPVEAFRKLNFDALEKEDAIFLKLHYKKALGQFITARKLDIKNISEEQLTEAREYAVEEAKKATYRDASATASAINRLSKNNRAANIFIEGIIPFKKTPINIIKRGIEYSSIGLIKTISKGTYDLKTGKINASEFIDGLASGLTGTGIMAIGVLLGSLGLAVGGLGGDDDEWFKKLNGEQEYSIIIGNKSYTIDWAAPACIPFFIGVELQRVLGGENENYTAAFLNSIDGALEPITNLSMLQGINDTISTAKWSDNPLSDILIDTVASYFTQALPTLGGQITRTFREERKKNYVDKSSTVNVQMQRFFNTVGSKTGEFGKTSYRNAWGETEPTGNGLERFLQNFLSPGYLSTVKYDDVNKEIQRLYESDGNKVVLPDTVDTKITQDGNTKYLNAEEYEKYQTEAGQNSYKYLSELFNTNVYKEADNDDKAEMIADVYSFAVNVAKTSVSDYELSKSDSKIKDWLDNGISAPYSIAAKNITKDLDNKSERHDALQNSNIPNGIKQLLQAMNIMGSKKIDTDNDGKTDTAFDDLQPSEQKEYINKNNSNILKLLENTNAAAEKSKVKADHREKLQSRIDVFSYKEKLREDVQNEIDYLSGAAADIEVSGDTKSTTAKAILHFDKSGFIDIVDYVKFYVYSKKYTKNEEKLEVINQLGISDNAKLRLKLWTVASGWSLDSDGDGKRDKRLSTYSPEYQEKWIKANAGYIQSNCSYWR